MRSIRKTVARIKGLHYLQHTKGYIQLRLVRPRLLGREDGVRMTDQRILRVQGVRLGLWAMQECHANKG